MALEHASKIIQEISDRIYSKLPEKAHDPYKEQLERDSAVRQVQYDIRRMGGSLAYKAFKTANYDNYGALEACKAYPGINLFLHGPAGTGKTHLATALLRQYPQGFVTKPQQIYRDCRGLNGTAEEMAAIAKYVNAPYMLIDDLGQDKKTDFSFSVLYEIIDGRWMNERKGLIVTSNLSLDQLTVKLDDDRIASRLKGMCKVINLTGKDRR